MKTNSSDSFEKQMIPKEALWGEQTQRSLHHFNIGHHLFTPTFIDAIVCIKKACAETNHEEDLLTTEFYHAILFACDELLQGHYADQFPLHIWQTGSGTQTNMNVNEVICSIANAYQKKVYQEKPNNENKQHQNRKSKIHPNDHVNMSQSSNDVFPSAMHIVVANLTREKLFKTLAQLDQALNKKQIDFEGVTSVGRTHLMDALPLPVSAIFSGYRCQLAEAKSAIENSLNSVFQLAVGGTAVGTGCNAPPNFGHKVSTRLAQYFQLPFKARENAYAAVSGEDALLQYSGALKQLASVLFKIANDFRLLGSGPRCGFNEWLLPANEPGSSIMPGKVNPTQCEALSMVCLQVFGNDLTVSLAASHGQLQLNTYRPVIIHNVMESIDLLSDAMASFAAYCVTDLAINVKQIESNMMRNLSAITVLAPTLGYDITAKIVQKAKQKNISLAEASESLGLLSQTEFEALLYEQFP